MENTTTINHQNMRQLSKAQIFHIYVANEYIEFGKDENNRHTKTKDKLSYVETSCKIYKPTQYESQQLKKNQELESN